jgi:hypothetical protein
MKGRSRLPTNRVGLRVHLRFRSKQNLQETKMMRSKTVSRIELGCINGDVEVDWGGFEPPTS